MDNRVNLIEYKRSYRSKEELRNVLYNLSKNMKSHHKNGEYISDFSPRTISVCWTNPSDTVFTKYRRFGQVPIIDVINLKINDIKAFALLSFCLFLDDYNLENGFLNIEVVQSNIENNLNIFVDSDREYYKNIFKSDKLFYYDDYVDTITGTVNEHDYKIDKGNESGIVNYLLLTSIIAITTMIISFILLVRLF